MGWRQAEGETGSEVMAAFSSDGPRVRFVDHAYEHLELPALGSHDLTKQSQLAGRAAAGQMQRPAWTKGPLRQPRRSSACSLIRRGGPRSPYRGLRRPYGCLSRGCRAGRSPWKRFDRHAPGVEQTVPRRSATGTVSRPKRAFGQHVLMGGCGEWAISLPEAVAAIIAT